MYLLRSFFFMAACCGVFSLSAQSETAVSENLGIGFHLSQYQQDFGVGLNVTSPLIAGGYLGFRLKGQLQWHEHPTNTDVTWSPYAHLSLGMFGIGGKIGDFIRLYGEGGVSFLLPNSDFSSADNEIGGYGLFGFEFFMQEHVNYYIELGGIGTGARADAIPGRPIYSNGFLMNVGARFYL